LIEAAIRRRQPLPDVIANAPQLFPGLEMYYEAFTELSTCRSQGFGVGPIPWTAIDRYGDRHGFLGEGFEYLVRMVRALDDTFLAYSRKRDKEERNQAEANQDAGTGRVREAD
jgi:hypothetical protein